MTKLAIELAQKAQTLDNASIVNNQEFIQNSMKRISGTLNIDGWKATRINDDIYLVEYVYDRAHVSWNLDTRYIFEVNIKQRLIRNVIGDYDLEELYRFIDTHEKLYKICYKCFNDNSAYFYKNGKLDIWGMVVLYPSFINIIQYNQTNKTTFDSEKFFGMTRKPYIQALIKYFSDDSEGNNMPQIYHKDYGDSITEYHRVLMDILNTALDNAHD